MAQNDIQGTVVDASGNPISGAIVELTKSYQSAPTTTESVKRTTTDANGNYIFTSHPDDPGTTQEYHVSCYNYDGTAYVNSENNPGVTADLSASAIPDSGVFRYEWEQSLADSWNNNDGTSTGGITYTTNSAVGSYGVSFDGVDDYVDSGVTIDLGQPFSLAYWVSTTDDGSGNDHFWSTFDGSVGALLQLDFNGNARFTINSATNAEVISNTTVNDGTYRLLTFVWDGSQLEAYINDANSQGTATGSGSGTNSTLKFGAFGDLNAYQAHTGDDPRLYDKALTATEVSNLFNTGTI